MKLKFIPFSISVFLAEIVYHFQLLLPSIAKPLPTTRLLRSIPTYTHSPVVLDVWVPLKLGHPAFHGHVRA